MTTLSQDDGDFRRSVYDIRARLLPPDAGEEDSIDLAPLIVELRVVKEFDTKAFPYYRMTLGLSTAVADRIRDCWRQSKLTLSISRLWVPRGEEGTRPVDAFDDYLKDAEFRIMETDLHTAAPPAAPGSDDSASSHAQAHLAVFELAPVVAIGVNKGTNVGAFHDVTVAEMVAFATVRSRPERSPYRFWMVPPDNERRYESVVLPPMSYVQTVRFIDQVYGLYRGTLSVFLDVDAGYILSSAKSIEPPEGRPRSVVLELRPGSYQGPESSQGSAYDADQRSYRLRHAGVPAVEVRGPGRQEAEGGHVRLLRSSHRERSGTNCKSLFPELTDFLFGGSDARQKQRVLWQSYDNELTVDRMRLQARENYSPMTVEFDGPDIGAFSPTLLWSVACQGEQRAELEGHWRLAAVEIVLTATPTSAEPAEARVLARLLPAAAM